jgi:hypothetical protein
MRERSLKSLRWVGGARIALTVSACGSGGECGECVGASVVVRWRTRMRSRSPTVQPNRVAVLGCTVTVWEKHEEEEEQAEQPPEGEPVGEQAEAEEGDADEGDAEKGEAAGEQDTLDEAGETEEEEERAEGGSEQVTGVEGATEWDRAESGRRGAPDAERG